MSARIKVAAVGSREYKEARRHHLRVQQMLLCELEKIGC